MNGAFKMEVTKAETIIYAGKPESKNSWMMTNIIPIVNRAFPESFGRVDIAWKAIINRGWGPLNYAILLHPDLQSKVNAIDTLPPLPIQLMLLPVSTSTASTITINIGAGLQVQQQEQLMQLC